MTAALPDPIRAAVAYQERLLSLLGDDDPAQVQERTPDLVRALIEEAGGDLRRRPAKKEWSVLELLGHLHDAEIALSARYRWTLSQVQPTLNGYDQDAWVSGLRHNQDDPAELLAVFGTLRAANLALWRRTPEPGRARVAVHAERGPETYDQMFRMAAGHDRFHLDQLRSTLDQVRQPRP
jgi:DinB superfamily